MGLRKGYVKVSTAALMQIAGRIAPLGAHPHESQSDAANYYIVYNEQVTRYRIVSAANCLASGVLPLHSPVNSLPHLFSVFYSHLALSPSRCPAPVKEKLGRVGPVSLLPSV